MASIVSIGLTPSCQPCCTALNVLSMDKDRSGKGLSWVEPVRPAPARDQVRFVGIECSRYGLDVACGMRAGGGDVDMAGHPGQRGRNERAQGVPAVGRSQTGGESKERHGARARV